MRSLIGRLLALALGSLGLLAALATPPPAGAETIHLGFPSNNLMTMPLYVAEEQGIFEKHGVDVELVYVRGGSAVNKAIVAKKLDAVLNEPISVMKAMQKGAQLTFVTALTQRASYQLVAKKEITSLAGLKGRTIGVSRPGAVSYIMPHIVLRRAGLDPDIASYLAIGTSGARRKALIAGKIDAAVMHVESALEAAAQPDLHILASVPELLPEYPFFWLAVHNDFLRDHPGEVTRLVKALVEVNRYVVVHKAATLRVAKEHMSVKEEYLSRGFDKLLELKSFAQNGGLTPEAYAFVVEVGSTYKELTGQLPASQFVNLTFQGAALQSLGRVPEDLTISRSK